MEINAGHTRPASLPASAGRHASSVPHGGHALGIVPLMSAPAAKRDLEAMASDGQPSNQMSDVQADAIALGMRLLEQHRKRSRSSVRFESPSVPAAQAQEGTDRPSVPASVAGSSPPLGRNAKGNKPTRGARSTSASNHTPSCSRSKSLSGSRNNRGRNAVDNAANT